MTTQTRLERHERRTEWPLAIVALIFLLLYSIDVLARPQGTVGRSLDYAMIATYVIFVVDYLCRLYLADPRSRWFFRHLFDLAIILLPALRPLRLLSLAVVIGVLQRAVGHNIRGKVIVYTGCGAVIIIYAAALAILDFERDAEGTAIKNIGDALWWSFTTVTTVGYGDTVPVTVPGRFVAVALMIAGVSLVGVVTATLASWIVQSVAAEDTASQAATAAHIEELRAEIRRLAETASSHPSPAYGESGDRGLDAREVGGS